MHAYKVLRSFTELGVEGKRAEEHLPEKDEEETASTRSLVAGSREAEKNKREAASGSLSRQPVINVGQGAGNHRGVAGVELECGWKEVLVGEGVRRP